MSKKLVIGLVAGAVTVGGIVIANCVSKDKKRKSKLEKVEEVYSVDTDFVPVKDMTSTRYSVKKVLDDLVPDKELPENKKATNFIDVYSYKGKEVFRYTYTTTDTVMTGVTTRGDAVLSSAYTVNVEFELVDNTLAKYADYYYAYMNIGYKVKIKESENWLDEFIGKIAYL